MVFDGDDGVDACKARLAAINSGDNNSLKFRSNGVSKDEEDEDDLDGPRMPRAHTLICICLADSSAVIRWSTIAASVIAMCWRCCANGRAGGAPARSMNNFASVCRSSLASRATSSPFTRRLRTRCWWLGVSASRRFYRWRGG